MKLRCLLRHDWQWRIDDTPESHHNPEGYRDVWAKCLRCGASKFLHSGVFVFRTYNPEKEMVIWERCTFNGEPPRPYTSWGEWAQSRRYTDVTLERS